MRLFFNCIIFIFLLGFWILYCIILLGFRIFDYRLFRIWIFNWSIFFRFRIFNFIILRFRIFNCIILRLRVLSLK